MKLIAVASMLADHLGTYLYPAYISQDVFLWLRAAGRLAFPLFAFLIVNGFEKTHDVKRYLTRLVAFAVISQIPFGLFQNAQHTRVVGEGLVVELGARWFVCLILIFVACVAWLGTVRRDGSVIWPLLALTMAVLRVEYAGAVILGAKLNVFYTLALGLMLIAVTDEACRPERDVIRLLMQVLGLFSAFFLIRDNADYRTLGAALIFAIWIARASRFSQAAVIILWCVVEYIVGGQPISHFFAAAASVIPILLYKGRQGPPLKLAFYAIYPLHLLVLGMLSVYALLT